jgi:alkylated DNA nucleotide flippase Atl1
MPSFPSLTPLYGLGSSARTVGAITISSPRTKNGSALRVYNSLKRTNGADYALQYMRNATFGPFIIVNGRLVYN